MVTNALIYTGLGILLLGTIYGIYVAVKGYEGRKGDGGKISLLTGFQPGSVTPQMKRLIWIWGVIMIIGFVLTGIGITIGLK